MHEWWVPLLEPDGLLLRDHALIAVDPDDLLTALRSGRLRRIQRGIYLPRRIEATPSVLARAALLSSGVVDAVPSHATAARVHQIAVPEERRVEHVTVTREQRRRNRPDLHFHTRSIGCGEVERRDGVPVTSVARTLADLATSLERLRAVWAMDDALRRRLCVKTEILAVIERWRGGAGCVSARERLDEADGVAESILETAGRLVLRDVGCHCRFRSTSCDHRMAPWWLGSMVPTCARRWPWNMTARTPTGCLKPSSATGGARTACLNWGGLCSASPGGM
jgi:hypothetical protein